MNKFSWFMHSYISHKLFSVVMFEKRTKKERTIIYAGIALVTTLILALMHYFLMGWILFLVIIGAVIEYLCIFYILYLPLKFQSD